MGSYRAKNASITELLKAHARGLLPGMLKVDQGNQEAILRALNNWGWDDDLKLYLPFDETSGATAHDLSGNGNTGTATGTTIVDGVFGKARSFNGTSDFVDCGPGGFVLTNMTLEVWANPAVNLIDQPDYVAFIDKGHSWSLATWRDGEVIMQTYYGDGTSWVRATSTTIPVANTWYHFAGVANGTDLIMYVNGVEEGRTSLPGTVYNKPTEQVLIGNDEDSPLRFFNGLIDEPRIYSRGLSADEMYLHWLAGALKLGLI